MTTLPHLMLEHARSRPATPAFREKSLGIWQMWTWSQVCEHVRRFAAGLSALGFGEGMHLAIVGDNRPHLYWSMLAAQSLGGVAVPLYQDANAADIGYVLKDADVAYVIAEDQEQVDKIIDVNRESRNIKHIIYTDPRGLHGYDVEGLISFEGVQHLGDQQALSDAATFDRHVQSIGDDAIAIILYTSGTTGLPKGVCINHKAMVCAATGTVSIDALTDKDVIFSYLPMAWVGDNLFSYAQALVAGFCVCCPESKETVMSDLREVGPTYFFAPPRIFEGVNDRGIGTLRFRVKGTPFRAGEGHAG